jgi:hypothetical protein
MSFTASLLLSVVLTVQPDSGLRLVNPHYVTVDATLTCGDAQRAVRLAPQEVQDLSMALCAAPVLDATLPLTVLETSIDDAVEWQRDVSSDTECGTAAMAVPLYACASGVAIASVTHSQGASYRWTATGATILEGMGGNRVVVQLTDPKTATLTCVITSADCTRTATGAISIREPLVVEELNVPTGINVNVPVTLTWSFEAGATPDTQMLLGDAFTEAVSLPGSARSYTFTPQQTGTRTVELLAGYGPHLVAAPKQRRRAVGGSVSATQCPSIRKSGSMEVRGCGGERAVLTAPRDVGAGETFKAFVNVDSGQKVEWSVENGSFDSIVSTGERAQVRAGTSGTLKLTARVERSPGCFAIADTEMPIILPAGQCAIVPTAQLALMNHDCDTATVSATFTGTPPFAGTWSDGTEFRTPSKLTTHRFTKPGVYGITRFRDGSCFGTLGGTVEVEALRASVNLQNISGSCGTNTLRATFGGVPPFSGHWSDGQTFTTSENVLERTVPGGRDWAVSARHASCAQLTLSKWIKLLPAPSVAVHGSGLCQILPDQGLTVGSVFTGGAPPYRLEWSNGLVTTGNDPHLWQKFPATTSSVEYQLVRATANGCEVGIERPTVSIKYRQRPVIAPIDRFNVLCVGQRHLQKLSVPPSPGAILRWDASSVGYISRGQGTQEVEFTADSPGWTKLSLATTYPDNICPYETTARESWYFSPPVWIDNLRFEPSTIKAGGTARLRYDHNNVAASWALYLPPDRKSDWNDINYTVTDTKGPGTFFIRMIWTDPCSGNYEETATLTITN